MGSVSFAEKGASGADDYLADASSTPVQYIDPLGKYSAASKTTECKVAWDEKGDEETNLEQIITQKWIAIFPLGNEAWAEYRRTGYRNCFRLLRTSVRTMLTLTIMPED